MFILKLSKEDWVKNLQDKITLDISSKYNLMVHSEPNGNLYFRGDEKNVRQFIEDYNINDLPSAKRALYFYTDL